MENNYFNELNKINVNDKIEQKNGLSYLSWAYAWGEVKKLYPDSFYTVYERSTEYGPVNYFTDGRTCWVKTGVTVNGLEHIESLPIMDNRNQSIFYDAVTSTDVNKAIQRSLTKAIARHGLGLYIYAGEDLPEEDRLEDEKQIAQLKDAVKEASISVSKPTGAAAPKIAPVASGEDTTALADVINNIGAYAKRVKTVYGDLKPYQDIVTRVTGNPNFKCNIAGVDDIPMLKQILVELQSDPMLK